MKTAQPRDDSPGLSVCVATHNGAAFVVEQITSILDQLDPGDEVVVVDDASRDDTVERILSVNDRRIRVERLTVNIGYVRTFERALELARGQLLLLADQDDVWPAGRVSVMRVALEDHAVVAGNLAILDGPSRLRGPFGEKDWRLRARDSDHPVRNLARLSLSDAPYFGSAMGLRREVLQVALPFPESVRELHDAWIALVGLGLRSMGHIEERVVLRRMHAANTSGRVRSPGAVVRGRWWFLRMSVDAWRRTRHGRARSIR